jgi:hypothetical protein
MATVWRHGGLVATPNVNLVSNAGFGPDATHTVVRTDAAGLATGTLGDLVHPDRLEVDDEADRLVYERRFARQYTGARSHPVGFARWMAQAAGRVVRRISNGGG